MRRILAGAVLTIALCGCAAGRPLATSSHPDRVGVPLALYLEPVPTGARSACPLVAVSALADDGAAHPLELHLTDLSHADLDRQRRLAFGRVPPGRYRGIEIAHLPAGAPPGTDLVPQWIDGPFELREGRGGVRILAARAAERPEPGGLGCASFTSSALTPVATGLLGLATVGGEDAVVLFDRISGQVAGVVPTGRGPRGVAVDPPGRRAYVALEGEDGVEAIDLQQMAVASRLLLGAGDRPSDLALTPDGSTLLVANSGSDTVSFVELPSLVERDRVGVGRGPRGVLVDRAGRQAFTFDAESDTVTVLDLAARRVRATLAVEPGPVRGDLDRDGGRLFVVQSGSPHLAVVELQGLSAANRIEVGFGAQAIRSDPRTGRLYLARRGMTTVDVYDPASFLPADSWDGGAEAAFLGLDPEGNALALVLPARRSVRLVRLVGHRTVAEVDVGRDPAQVAFVGRR